MRIIIVAIAIVYFLLYCEVQGVHLKENSKVMHHSPSGDISQCHGVPCPVGTVRCNAKRGSSLDYTYWLTTVECINVHGIVLHSALRSSVTPDSFDKIDNKKLNKLTY